MEIRISACELFFKMHDQGYLPLDETIKRLVALQADTCQYIRIRSF